MYNYKRRFKCSCVKTQKRNSYASRCFSLSQNVGTGFNLTCHECGRACLNRIGPPKHHWKRKDNSFTICYTVFLLKSVCEKKNVPSWVDCNLRWNFRKLLILMPPARSVQRCRICARECNVAEIKKRVTPTLSVYEDNRGIVLQEIGPQLSYGYVVS